MIKKEVSEIKKQLTPQTAHLPVSAAVMLTMRNSRG